MQTNEIPDKIYLSAIDLKTVGSCLTHSNDTEDVEYIRTDVFIKKVYEFIKNRIDVSFDVKYNKNGEPLAKSYVQYMKERLKASNKMIEDFKNYLKE